MNIGDALRRTAREYPERIAIIDKLGKYTPPDTTYTWRDINKKVNQLAHSLRSLGLQKQDRIAVYSETRAQFFIAYHAIVKAGMVLVPINTAYKGDELLYLLRDSDPRAVILDADKEETVSSISHELPDVRHFIGIGPGHGCALDFDMLFEGQPNTEPHIKVTEDDIASLLYTSGTTGHPKGAVLTHRNWCFSGILLPLEWRILPHYRFLSSLAPFFSGGVGFMTLAAFRGFTLIMSDWNTEKIMKIIQDERIDYTMFAPAMTSMIVNHPQVGNYDFSSIKRIITSAAPISSSLVKKACAIFGDVYTMTYGTTETALGGCQLYPEDVASEGPLSRRLSSVGKSMSAMDVRVLDESGNDVIPGSDQIGEVVVSGPTVGKAYWKKPEATDLKDGTWFSGDLARVDEDGYIYIVDRKKDMILSGGTNIYPREIEDVLYAHPAVLQAAVIGIPNEQWGESVKAVIALNEGAHASEAEIIEHCRQHLAEYKKPRCVEFRDRLPLNPSGKILKRQLREEHWKDRERKV